uniref:Uncharacterized protein n=1 Tax=Haemonchus contortus TaxID=6289 RepID=W6NHW4_HAECO
MSFQGNQYGGYQAYPHRPPMNPPIHGRPVIHGPPVVVIDNHHHGHHHHHHHHDMIVDPTITAFPPATQLNSV